MQQVRHTCGGNRPQTAQACLQEAAQGLVVVFRFRVSCFVIAVSTGFGRVLEKVPAASAA